MRRLSYLEGCLVLAAAAMLPLVGLSLYLLGYRRTAAFLTRTAPSAVRQPRPGSDALAVAATVRRCVRIAAQWGPYRATCLRQSLVLRWLLQWARVPAVLRLGVRRHSGEFSAHAWVEVAGRPVNDSADVATRFLPFYGTESDPAVRLSESRPVRP